MDDFRKELESLINRHSVENLSNTPDFILADYVMSCLYVFETATLARDKCKESREKALDTYVR